MYGKGLNSIRVRFTMLLLAQSALIMLLDMLLERYGGESLASGYRWAFTLGCAFLFFTATTYLMTGRLTRPIESLKASTEAIARGDLDAPVNVDCNCEVGGLADSFRLMVDRLNQNVSRINKLAYEDSITGLPNRSVLADLLRLRPRGSMWVLFIDLDHFKRVNDTFGHATGDRLLLKAAERISAEGLTTTPEDVRRACADEFAGWTGAPLLFRFAGDEFIAVLDGRIGEDEVRARSLAVVAALNRVFDLNDNAIRIGCSVGIARLDGQVANPEDVLQYADLAMYEAKKAGRGGIAFFDAEMREKAESDNRLENELFQAVEQGELVLHYQPKVSLQTGAVTGVEALVRWQHPQRGLLPPGLFIPIAESSGQMERIGREVMRMAARQAGDWKAHGLPIKISVNVCPTQFINENFAQDVVAFLDRIGFDPAMLELELTESVAMADPAQAARQLAVLREKGIRIAIDDYGTGYSNLAQLYSLPFDVLKLDRSLVRDISENPGARTIASATIDMAHRLGHTVVAEGAETLTEVEMLRRKGCDEVQGYFFARPMPAAELPDWLEAHRIEQPLAQAS